MSFITGRNMSSIFDIRGKKKDITLPSPFPKKKQPFRIGFTPGPETAGSHQQNYFLSTEPITSIFDNMLEEMTKFQDPIIIPESQIFRLNATYYKVKPSVGSSKLPTTQKSPGASLRSPAL